MSFGRWLLVHSFSIFLLVLFMFGYIYRGELQLENAYQQLLNIDPKAVVSHSSGSTQPEDSEKQKPLKNSIEDTENTGTIQAADNETAENVSSIEIVSTVPTVSTTEAKAVEIDQLDERLFLARQAYWDKNYADAIYFYQQLIQQNGNNPDYLGELGNIYYSLNDNKNASRLYYQAAQVFIQQKQPERARSLLAPITAMNRELGDKLKHQLR